ncbi:MAG: transporter substrate-binding domain-containing protein [Paucibacter sp.]|nr:transporter substrate-binding domain-containing protein [Roseateles sp.]
MKISVLALAWLLSATVNAADLRVAVDQSTEMPWAEITEGAIVNGIHRDLGLALAARLGLQAKFVVLPRKRVPILLSSGEVDVVCAMLPEWLPGPFLWTKPFLDSTDVVLTVRSATRPTSVASLADVPLGTIVGFSYPTLETALGSHFVRDDAPSADANLRKLELGRLQHVVTNQRLLDYRSRRNALKAPTYPPLVIVRQEMSCALSPRGHVSRDSMNQAISSLRKSDALSRMLDAYR